MIVLNVIVTGAAGFIGTWLVHYLSSQQDTVFAIINRTNATYNYHNTHIITGGIERLFDYNFPKIDCVFDFAWTGSSGVMRSDLQKQINNVVDRKKVVEFCSKHECKYIGSGSIMEKESITSTFNKLSSPPSSYIYSHAKYMAHAITKTVANNLGVDYVWGRITNTYGPGERSPRLINSTIVKILNKEIPSFSSGVQYYDFIHVSDLVRAFVLMAEHGRNNSDYVIGSGNPHPLRYYLDIINKIIAPGVNFIYGPDPDVSKIMNNDEFDNSQLCNDTGFTPLISFENGILDTISYYKGQMKL